ncbi:hypothetical protein O206_00900 [Ochrobactrum sp. EGD-AQ16]|nr:hypothetical protein O206_00900 [Ochrobactrum sp. EGD-AQ16]
MSLQSGNRFGDQDMRKYKSLKRAALWLFILL